MEPFVYEAFNKDLLFHAADVFGITRESLTKISTSESFVYAGFRSEKEVILRITYSTHRNEEEY